nr:WYL domain-containing protein [Rhizobium acidisoli]
MAARKADHPLQRSEKRAGTRLCYLPSATPLAGTRSSSPRIKNIWRFAPEAASRAAEFRFHPSQVLESRDDGSLIVRFHAAGWLEMTWHLYQWGDKWR